MNNIDNLMQKPLHGIRVVDVSTSYAGPYCSMMLAEMGAEVIKIEKVNGGDDSRTWGPPFLNNESPWYLSSNKSKKSLALNLKDPKGLKIFNDLIKKADVFIENLKSNSLKKMSIDFDTIRTMNPSLIYCSISGFGRTGPYKDYLGYDLIAQAMSGMMSVTGEEGGKPQRVGTSLSDISTGMNAAFCIVSALFGRMNNDGNGRYLDVSLLETDVSLMAPRIATYFIDENEPGLTGGTDSAISIYQSFETLDKEIVLCVGTNEIWKRFCNSIHKTNWINDPKYESNSQRKLNKESLIGQIKEILLTKKADYWVDKFRDSNVPCAITDGLSEVVSNPQLIDRNMIQEINHPTIGKMKSVGRPWKLNNDFDNNKSAPPLLGEHTFEILKELGYSKDAIHDFKEKEVVYLNS
ncbi:CaiB/BaiF CoA transferase family protein [Virgibacillus natechei]